MPKLNTIITLLLVGFTLHGFCQKPAWTEYSKRVAMYPKGEYITGYISGTNTNNEESGELKSKYETLAKDKVIQSIHVEIETNNSLNISNINGKSGEEFLSKSVSFSKADVAGLLTFSYYDRKRKEVYAFSYVNKKELAFYYRNIIKSSIENIEQKLKQGKEYVKKGNKEEALRSYYEAMPDIQKIDEARTLLIALNRKMYADINIDEIVALNLSLNNEISTLLKPNDLNLSETAYFIAYGLFLQLGEIQDEIIIDEFGYENTGLGSSFSEKLNQEIASGLVSAGGYKVSKKDKSKIVVSGNYWKEGELLKINAIASKNDKIIGVSKGSLPIEWLTKETIDYIPVQIQLMNNLNNIKLNIVESPGSITLGMPIEDPVIIEVVNHSVGNGVDTKGIPLEVVSLETNLVLCGCTTDKLGIASCYLPSIQTINPIFKVKILINLSEYLNIERSSTYFVIASQQNPVLPIEVDLITQNPTIYVSSRELIQGEEMDIKTLEPSLKEILAEEGYNFVEDKNDADFIVNISANTTTGSKYEGIYFSYLDINLTVTSAKNNEEVYSIHLDQIKGGGNSYLKAGKKAYVIGASKIKERMSESGL